MLRLPPYSPELNPIETLFSVLKHGHFANRVFESAEHVRETVTQVWDAFTHKTGEIIWEGSDVNKAVPMVVTARARFPDLRTVNFDRGFYSPRESVPP